MLIMYLLSYILIIQVVTQLASAQTVEQLNEWPQPVESIINFKILKKSYNTNSEVLIKILDNKDVELSHKYVLVKKKYYVDLSTDCFVIKKEKKVDGDDEFFLSISFYLKSYGKYLTMSWCDNGQKDCSESPFYKKIVELTKEWQIGMSVEVLEFENLKQIYKKEISYFQPGKRVKVTCIASGGLPSARVSVHKNFTKQFREVLYDELLNQWVGTFTLDVNDHEQNISCQVDDTNQIHTYRFIVNHPTTMVKLSPEHDGYIKNGTTKTCQPYDGYPLPTIKWRFVSSKNYSSPNSLFEIKNDNLTILSSVPIGTEMVFNCTASYTNPLDNKETVVTRTFEFIVGEKPNNIDHTLNTNELSVTPSSHRYANLNMAAIGASVAGVIIVILAVTIVIMLCRSKPKPSRSSSTQQQGSPKYAGSLLAGSKAALRNQVKGQNGSNMALVTPDSSLAGNTDQNELNYDDMPRGRRPIKVVDDPVIYSTIVGTMQPKSRPSLDLGPIDRV